MSAPGYRIGASLASYPQRRLRRQQWRGGVSLLLALTTACADQGRSAGQTRTPVPSEEHAVLAGSFARADSALLRPLLYADIVVQPPLPDSALQGSTAIDYLLRLAAATSVDQSWLEPTAVVSEGPFAFEQGVWHLRVGDHVLRSPYTLRWRDTADGWKVVLWRWAVFR